MVEYRLLRREDMGAAAQLHRIASTLIPDFDAAGQRTDEIASLYSGVFERGSIWGAVEGDLLAGVLALEPGWTEHLYVEPSRNGRGIGRALVEIAQREQDDLQLFTWRSNVRARKMYEAAGFIAEEFGFDERGDEAVPNVRYRWRRSAA